MRHVRGAEARRRSESRAARRRRRLGRGRGRGATTSGRTPRPRCAIGGSAVKNPRRTPADRRHVRRRGGRRSTGRPAFAGRRRSAAQGRRTRFDVAAVEEHLGARRTDPVVDRDRADQRPQPARIDRGVVVDQGDEIERPGARMPRLHPPANPVLASGSMIRTPGISTRAPARRRRRASRCRPSRSPAGRPASRRPGSSPGSRWSSARRRS